MEIVKMLQALLQIFVFAARGSDAELSAMRCARRSCAYVAVLVVNQSPTNRRHYAAPPPVKLLLDVCRKKSFTTKGKKIKE